MRDKNTYELLLKCKGAYMRVGWGVFVGHYGIHTGICQ